jgi:uncharacterized protein (TIGR03437 family)
MLPAQTLSLYSGNGQIVEQLFQAPVPLVVQAKDASGKPLAGVAVTWSATPATNGTLVNMTNVTDANGLASTSYLAVPNGSVGMSFLQTVVTATSPSGTVSFFLTISLSSSSVGGLGAPPLVQVQTPAPGTTITGSAGSTIAGAIKVLVVAQSGDQAGQPIPNVGVTIPPNASPALPSASCAGPAGTTLTNASGIATCDLVLGSVTGTVPFTALVGDITYTPTYFLDVTPAVACAFTVTPMSQTFGATGGMDTISVASASGCTWTATANETWLSLTAGANGSGTGLVSYSAAADSGTARMGTLTIAGQTVTISEAGATGPVALAIAAPNLPVAPANESYSTLLTASGGTPPYTWSSNGGLPPGLVLNSTTGIISGTPTTTGTYNFVATVVDSQGITASRSFTITVAATGVGPLITNSGFPQGVIGQPYSQTLTSTGGCSTPFTPAPKFSVLSGMLPAGLTIQSGVLQGTPTTAGTYNFTLAATDSCGNVGSASFSIIVTTIAVPVLSATPASLSFTTAFMSTTAPPSQTLLLSPGGLTYSAAATTSLGGNWLTVGSTSAGTPGPLTVSVANTSQLNPGAYSGTITLTSPTLAGSLQIPVTLTVSQVSLNVSPLSVAVTLPSSGQTISQQQLRFTTLGAPVNFTAAVASGAPWLTVTPNSGTSPATLMAVINSSGLTAGLYNGSIVVTTAYGNLTVSVALTVVSSDQLTASPASLSLTASADGTAVTQSLAVVATGAAAQVTFTASTANGTWLSVAPSSGTTPVTATVSANPSALAAGTYAGSITVASPGSGIASMTVPVTLTVTTPSAIPQMAAVTNAASFVPGPVAPGELITIFGSGIGPVALAASSVSSSGVVEDMVADTQVLFDGNPAPIIYTSTVQVAVIVPYEVASDASTILQIVYKGVKSNQVNLRVVSASPAMFTLNTMGQGAILDQDGTVNSATDGASAGSIVSIYATGAGQTSPSGVDGKIAVAGSLAMPVLPVTVSIGGEQAEVLYAGDAPGLASGVLQVNVKVPANLTSGTEVPVGLNVGSYTSPTVRMWIK